MSRPSLRSPLGCEIPRALPGSWRLGPFETRLRPRAADAGSRADAFEWRGLPRHGAPCARECRTVEADGRAGAFDQKSRFTSAGVRAVGLAMKVQVFAIALWLDQHESSAVGIVVFCAGFDVIEPWLLERQRLVRCVLERLSRDTVAVLQAQDALHAAQVAQRVTRMNQRLHQLERLGPDPLGFGLC